MAKIVVDLTPVLPGGENGGAKVMVLALIKHLGKIAPKDHFILLTGSKAHQELAHLDSHNIRRICVLGKKEPANFVINSWKKITNKLLSRSHKTFLERLKADLLFCPFTAPFFAAIGIPVVSVIYDLQYLDCAYFFSSHDRYHRGITFQKACQTASYLVCISEFTRQSVLKNSATPLLPEKVISVPICFSHGNVQLDTNNRVKLLAKYNLQHESFLFYPANFWQHKNHKMLFTAFSMYCKKYPNSTLKLVCTGAPSESQQILIAAVEKMGLSERIIFPGYVSSELLSALLFSCRAVIFPSLYEGFGMPVVEAMLAKKPILSSNKGSLPEVGKNSVYYFEPTKLKEIFSAIYEIEHHLDRFEPYILSAYEQAREYLGVEEMAKRYYKVLQEAIQSTREPASNTLQGVFEDNWTSEKISIGYTSSKEQKRVAEIKLSCPEYHTQSWVNIILHDSHNPKKKKKFTIKKGEHLTITHTIKSNWGYLNLFIKGSFQPAKVGMGEDTRTLGCLFHGYNIITSK